MTRIVGTAVPGSQQRNLARERALLSIARECQARGTPLPSVDRLAKAFGVWPAQVITTRQRLEREGMLATRQAYVGRLRRLFVERVA
jgi:DNA-binding transcriptional MocR family regulator